MMYGFSGELPFMRAMREAAEKKLLAQTKILHTPPAHVTGVPKKPNALNVLATVPDKKIADRSRWAAAMRDKNLFNGSAKIRKGKIFVSVPIKNGVMDFDGTRYAVSKDGKYVINKNFLLVGVIGTGQVMRSPTPEDIKAFSHTGRVV